MDDIKPEARLETKPPEVRWKWRPGRWKAGLIAFGLTGVVGSHVIRFMITAPDMEYAAGAHNGEQIFVVSLLLLCAVLAAFTDREWPARVRVLWVFWLLILHFLMRLLPFGIITGILTLGMVSSSVLSALILFLWVMRRSTFFVEAAAAPPVTEK